MIKLLKDAIPEVTRFPKTFLNKFGLKKLVVCEDLKMIKLDSNRGEGMILLEQNKLNTTDEIGQCIH